MKFIRHIISLFPYFIVFPILGQNTVSGKVVSTDGEPLINCVCKFLDPSDSTTLYSYTLTDSEGNFTGSLPYNKYLLRLSYVGYSTKDTIINDGELKNLEFTLEPIKNSLESVVITARKPLFKYSSDTITYDVKSLFTGAEDNASELLDKLPGISLDAEGNILYRGKRISNLQIDNKLISTSSGDYITKSMIADALSNIQIFSSGEDEDKYTLNLLLRDNYRNRLFGRIESELGINRNYKLDGNTFYVKDKSILTGILNSNTINNSKITVQDYVNFFGLNSFTSNPNTLNIISNLKGVRRYYGTIDVIGNYGNSNNSFGAVNISNQFNKWKNQIQVISNFNRYKGINDESWIFAPTNTIFEERYRNTGNKNSFTNISSTFSRNNFTSSLSFTSSNFSQALGEQSTQSSLDENNKIKFEGISSNTNFDYFQHKKHSLKQSVTIFQNKSSEGFKYNAIDQIAPSPYSEIFDFISNFPSESIDQDISKKETFFGSNISYNWQPQKSFLLEYKINTGISRNDDSYRYHANNETLSSQNFTFNKINIENQVKLSKGIKTYKFSLGGSYSYVNSYSNKDRVFLPKIEVKKKITPYSKIGVGYITDYVEITKQQELPVNVIQSYRNMSEYGLGFEVWYEPNFKVTYENINPYTGLFLLTTLSKQVKPIKYVTNNRIQSNTFIISKPNITRMYDSFHGLIKIDKTFSKQISLKVSSNQSYNHYSQNINSDIIKVKNTTFNSRMKMIYSHKSQPITTNFIIDHSYFRTIYGNTPTKQNIITSQLSTKLKLNKVKINPEVLYTAQKIDENRYNGYLFVNSKFQYNASSKIGLSLNLLNVTNVKSFGFSRVNDDLIYRNEESLEGVKLLCGVYFKY